MFITNDHQLTRRDEARVLKMSGAYFGSKFVKQTVTPIDGTDKLPLPLLVEFAIN